jgi:hypothetical protein
LTKGFSCLPDIVLEQPRLCEGTSNLDLLVAMEPGLSQCPNKKGGGFNTGPFFERPRRLPVKIGGCHGAQYSRYTGEVDIDWRLADTTDH